MSTKLSKEFPIAVPGKAEESGEESSVFSEARIDPETGISIYLYPNQSQIAGLVSRPFLKKAEVEKTVKAVIDQVKEKGDAALYEYAERFDKVTLSSLRVSRAEFETAETLISQSLRLAMQRAAKNIAQFHAAQKSEGETLDTEPGVSCWRKIVPLQRVGLYVPGGTAPLFSTVLMLAIPAKLAGCKDILLFTPPNAEGTVHPAIIYAAKIAGVTEIITAGGAQAIAAMAYGTETIQPVDKIFGPGNQYVTAAKQLVAQDSTAIDMPAGPSEVMVVADATSYPATVAADMLSQAEHGADSQALLVVDIAEENDLQSFLKNVLAELADQLNKLPRKDLAGKSLAGSRIICTTGKDQVCGLINAYAPEHLILNVESPERYAEGVLHAGSVFMGPWTPESAGDYASGTNHTLPTNGWARSYSGVSLDSFVKKITFQRITREALQSLGPDIEILAHAESLTAHEEAVTKRLHIIKKLEQEA